MEDQISSADKGPIRVEDGEGYRLSSDNPHSSNTLSPTPSVTQYTEAKLPRVGKQNMSKVRLDYSPSLVASEPAAKTALYKLVVLGDDGNGISELTLQVPPPPLFSKPRSLT